MIFPQVLAHMGEQTKTNKKRESASSLEPRLQNAK